MAVISAQTASQVQQPPKLAPSSKTILLYGVTGSGKTALIGEMAEWLYKTKKLKTRLYTADLGGTETIRPHIELGLIDVQFMFGDNPWFWIDNAVKGRKWDGTKWIEGIDPQIGMYAYEGLTAFSDSVMSWMRAAATRNVNIGGGGSISFTAGAGADAIKIGSNNMSHYMVAQGQVYEKSTLSQHLPGIVLWTAGDSRNEDEANGATVGPQTAGKAQTSEVPRWFKYTFRVTQEVTLGQLTKHVLYTDAHIEMAAKGAKAIANARIPLAGQGIDIPARIEPASLVRVLELLEERQTSAKDDLRKRLGL